MSRETSKHNHIAALAIAALVIVGAHGLGAGPAAGPAGGTTTLALAAASDTAPPPVGDPDGLPWG